MPKSHYYFLLAKHIIISSVQKNSESDLKTLTYGSEVSNDFNVDYLQILRKEEVEKNYPPSEIKRNLDFGSKLTSRNLFVKNV